jgi:CubicO group peptidase (beta-lactamase class C family)
VTWASPDAVQAGGEPGGDVDRQPREPVDDCDHFGGRRTCGGVRLRAASGSELPAQLAQAMSDPQSLTYRTMTNPDITNLSVFNTRPFHEAEVPAANRIASARALARMYASCIGPVDGIQLLGNDMLTEACRPQAEGLDLVGLEERRFGLGFMLPFTSIPFAGPSSFGHDGAGGALAFADRATGMSFAFLTDRFPARGGADPDVQPLISAALECLRTGG